MESATGDQTLVLAVASGASAPLDDDKQDVFSLSSVTIALLAVYILYYLLFVVQKPSIYSSEGLKQFLLKHCPILQESYWPTIWCMEARLQTVLFSLIQSSPSIEYQREILELSDGGQLGLDWAVDDDSKESSDDDSRAVIIILPGLTGSSQVAYVLHLVKQCLKLKYRCVVMNYRGINGVPIRTPRTYCAAKTEDLHQVVERVERKYPHCPIMAVGVSLGGIILTNYLAQQGGSSRLVAGMTVSSPFNLFTSSKSLRQGLNMFLFNQYLCNCLKRTIRPHEAMFKDICDMDHIYKSKTIADFDARFTVPVFGYKDLNDYYTDATTDYKLHDINVPLLCLNAADDSFYPGQYLPVDKARHSSNVIQVVTPRGGHIAFMEGCLVPSEVGYIERLFSQFSTAILNQNSAISTELQAPEAVPVQDILGNQAGANSITLH